MTIENTLERIAVSLEKIALAQLHPATTVGAQASTAAPASEAKTEAAKVARIPRAATAAAATGAPATAAVVTNGHAKAPVSFEEMRNSLVGVKVKLGQEKSRAIMGSVGAANVTEIKPEDFGKVVAECARAMA